MPFTSSLRGVVRDVHLRDAGEDFGVKWEAEEKKSEKVFHGMA
jgi:hypothetical protein